MGLGFLAGRNAARNDRPLAWRHARALAWTGVDQAFSTLSNVLVSLALARGAGARGLGAFTVAFSTYLVVLGFQRALIADPLLAAPPDSGDQNAERAALGAAAIFSGTGAMAVLGIGTVLGRPEFLALALVLPLICLQDFLRYIAFRRLKPQAAVLLDAIWTVVSAGAWWYVAAGSVHRAVLVWGAGGALGAVWGCRQLGLLPSSPRTAWRWWNRDARAFGVALAIEGIAYTFMSQLSVFIVAGALGDDDLGLLRAAQILLAPAAPLLAAFCAFALPRLARRADTLDRGDAQLASLAALGLVTPISLGALAAAEPLTRLLYGSSMSVPSHLLVPLALVSWLGAAGTGPVLTLKARRRGQPLVSARIVTGALGLAFIAVALRFGLVAVAWAGAMQVFAYTIAVWWLELGPRVAAPAGAGVRLTKAPELSKGSR
jgi:O-antigen/teichoic acid export membrane protein